MRKNFLYIVVLILLLTRPGFCADEMSGKGFYDLDFSFIDNPFSGQKMVTDADFQKTYDKYKQNTTTKKNKGFWNWVFKHTLPKEKQNIQTPSTNVQPYSDEIRFQKEMLKQKPTIALSDSIMDSRGREIKEGFYQVEYEDSKIKLVQGYDTVGIFNAKKTTDNWNENKIIYARVVYQGEDILKIIYSNLDDCYEAYAAVKKKN